MGSDGSLYYLFLSVPNWQKMLATFVKGICIHLMIQIHNHNYNLCLLITPSLVYNVGIPDCLLFASASWKSPRISPYLSRVCWVCDRVCSSVLQTAQSTPHPPFGWWHAGVWSNFMLQHWEVHVHVQTSLCYHAICFRLRFESFNSIIRTQNIYGNRHAPSRDIAHSMAVQQQLRFVCSGGIYDQGHGTRYFTCMCQKVKGLQKWPFLSACVGVDRAFVHCTRLCRCRAFSMLLLHKQSWGTKRSINQDAYARLSEVHRLWPHVLIFTHNL